VPFCESAALSFWLSWKRLGSVGGNSTAGFSIYVQAILCFSRFCFEFRTFESQAYLMFLFYVSVGFIYFLSMSSVEIRGFKLF